jgi:hypothetical protein
MGTDDFPSFFDILIDSQTGKVGRLAEMGYKVIATWPFGQAVVAPVA